MPYSNSGDFEGRRNRAKFVDPNTRASNPGSLQVQWSQYFRVFPNTLFRMMRMLHLPALALGAMLTVHWLFVVPLLGALAWIWHRMQTWMRSISEFFAFGDTVPGVILSQQPPLVAFYTDLTTGSGTYPVIKVVKQPLRACGLGNAPLKTRVAAVATYGRSKNPNVTLRHWVDFHPVLVNTATRDIDAQRRALRSIDESDWNELENSLFMLPSVPTPGLYPLGWNL